MAFSTCIIKTEYFPPISTLWAASNSDGVLLEVTENYQKKSTRNRSKILGVNGIEVLSVPLKKGKNNKMSISQVEISYQDNWKNKHLNSIKSAYGNAPYFEFYYDAIEQIINTKHDLLIDLNQSLFDFINQSLDLDLEIKRTESYAKAYTSLDCDLRSLKFNDPKIQGYTAKKYNQVFEEKHGFIADISILDLLMCKGPESILYI
jgi:hypothetical protein